MKTNLIKLTILTLIAASLSACATTPLTNQKLMWRPTNDGKEFNVGKLSKHKIKVEAFTDERKMTPKNKIAENTEKEEVRDVLADTDNFGPFVTENFKKTLSEAGLDVVDSGETLSINGEIKDLFVTESNIYKGTATIKYTVHEGAKEVWSGVETGTSKRFGRSYKMQNYDESVSDSIVDSEMKLMNDPAFRSALK